jgi:tetratricopeptide (TPR) repeat protein
MEDLLAGLVPGLPAELRAQILARAEGVPLYAVETVRMLLDRGALAQDGPVYRPTGTIESLEVPETLHALIAARLDGLPVPERHAVQNAAVLGKTFTKEALASLGGQPQAELEPILASLARKEVFGVQADPRSPEHGQYGFLQDLLRKVAYDTLAKSERKARHLAAAAHLEQSMIEQEVVEVVASHYLAAYEAAPDAPDAGEIKGRAGSELARAGERAASLGANEEAERYFAQAAELADEPLARAELEERAGRMAYRAGRREAARGYFDRATGVFEAEGLTSRSALISAVVAEIDWREGHTLEAVARLEATVEALGEDDPDENVATVAGQLGRFLALAGRSDEAAPHLERALELAEALNLFEVFAHALTSKSVNYESRNRLEESRILLEGALELALANDLHSAAFRAFNNLAVNHESADRYAQAVEVTLRALELARRVGDKNSEQSSLYGPVSSYVLLGEWDEALARAALADDERPQSLSLLLLPLVVVDCARGDVAGARARLDADPAVRESDDPQSRLGYASAAAHVLRAEGKLRDAVALAETGHGMVNEIGITFLSVKLAVIEELEAAFALGDNGRVEELVRMIEELRPGERPPLLAAHAHRFRSKLDGNETGFRSATALFRELELSFWLGVTQLEHGEAGGPEQLLVESRAIFQRLGATPWLERAGGTVETAEVTA